MSAAVSGAERVAALFDRRERAGLRLVRVWVAVPDVPLLKRYASRLTLTRERLERVKADGRRSSTPARKPRSA